MGRFRSQYCGSTVGPDVETIKFEVIEVNKGLTGSGHQPKHEWLLPVYLSHTDDPDWQYVYNQDMVINRP